MSGFGFKHYQDVVRLPEYQAILYTKVDAKKKVWQCRMKPQKGPAIIKSTKTTSLAAATDFAKDWYEAVKTAERAGLSARQDGSFVAVWSEFLKAHQDGRMADDRLDTMKGIVEKYYCRFFGATNVRSITPGMYEEYKGWRLSYWTSGPGVQELLAEPNKRHAKVPAPATLAYEHSCFIQVLRWSVIRGYLASNPVFPGFKRAKGVQKTRGGGIEPLAWMKIVNRLKVRAFNPTNKDGEPITLGATHAHERACLYYLVVFMSGTMCRPSEALQLKWRHLKWEQNVLRDDVENLIIRIPAQVSKTKEARTAVGTNRAAEYMRNWKARSKHNAPDDYLFPRSGGQKLGSPNKTFKKVCQEVGITHDHDDLKITLYSCRHYAITAFLMRKIPILEVAILAGTSVHHIEKRYFRADMMKRTSIHALQPGFDPNEIRELPEEL